MARRVAEVVDVPVPRVTLPSAAAFERVWRAPAHPVIIQGALESWPARQQWTLDYLRGAIGERELDVVPIDPHGYAGYSAEAGVHYRKRRVSDVIDELTAGHCSDYLIFRVQQEAPQLLEDVRPLPYAAKASWRQSRFWLAPPGANGALHFDLPDNLYAQFLGSKEWVLFEPKDTLRVYPHPPWSGVPNYAQVDAIQPDLQRFPRLGGLTRYRAVIEPGELLYVPRLWWHQVRSVDVSLAMNFWWAQGPTLGVVRLAEVLAKLRGLRL